MSFPLRVLVLVVVGLVVMVAATAPLLPVDGGDGWMGRRDHVAVALGLGAGLPLVVAFLFGNVPGLRGGMDEVFRRHGCWLGTLVAVFFGAVHVLVVRASVADAMAPVFSRGLFALALGGFTLGLGVWCVVFLLCLARR